MSLLPFKASKVFGIESLSQGSGIIGTARKQQSLDGMESSSPPTSSDCPNDENYIYKRRCIQKQHANNTQKTCQGAPKLPSGDHLGVKVSPGSLLSLSFGA